MFRASHWARKTIPSSPAKVTSFRSMTIGRPLPSDWINDSNSASLSPSIRPLSAKTVSPLDDLRTLNMGSLFRRRSSYDQSETAEQSRAEFPLRNGIARRQPHVTLTKHNEWRN